MDKAVKMSLAICFMVFLIIVFLVMPYETKRIKARLHDANARIHELEAQQAVIQWIPTDASVCSIRLQASEDGINWHDVNQASLCEYAYIRTVKR